MIHVSELLSDQLLANANDQSFYVPFEQAVNGLSEADAVWKPHSEANSIYEIVTHLIYWNSVWQTRFTENTMKAVEAVENNDTFNVDPALSFKAQAEHLLGIMLKWQNLMDPKKLETKIPDFPVPADWWALIGNVMSHNAYHIGQIAYIRKQCTPDWTSGIT